jgi:hypothetical protein
LDVQVTEEEEEEEEEVKYGRGLLALRRMLLFAIKRRASTSRGWERDATAGVGLVVVVVVVVVVGRILLFTCNANCGVSPFLFARLKYPHARDDRMM